MTIETKEDFKGKLVIDIPFTTSKKEFNKIKKKLIKIGYSEWRLSDLIYEKFDNDKVIVDIGTNFIIMVEWVTGLSDYKKISIQQFLEEKTEWQNTH